MGAKVARPVAQAIADTTDDELKKAFDGLSVGSRTKLREALPAGGCANGATIKAATEIAKAKEAPVQNVSFDKDVAPSDAQPKKTGAALAALYLALFLDVAGGFMVMPILPFVALKFGANAFEIGFMTAAFSMTQMVGGLVLGVLSDSLGRRKVLLSCLAASAVSLVLFGLAQTFFQLLIYRCLSGFFSGTMGTAQAMVADLVPEKDRTNAMGKCGAMIGLALIFAPAAGALLMTWGFECVSFTAGGVTLFNFVVALFALPKPSAGAKSDAGESQSTKGGLCSTLKEHPRIGGIFCMHLLYMTGFGVFSGSFALYLHDLFGIGARALGGIMAIAGFTMIFIQISVLKRICNLLGEPAVFIIAIFTRVLLFGMLCKCNYSWIPVAMPIGVVAGAGLYLPLSSSILSQIAPFEVRGSVMGAQSSIASAGSFIGPLVGGLMYQKGSEMNVWIFPLLCNVLAVIIGVPCMRKMKLAETEEPESLSKLVDDDEEQDNATPSNQQPLLRHQSSKVSRRPSIYELVDNTNAFALPASVMTPHVGGDMWTVVAKPATLNRRNTDPSAYVHEPGISSALSRRATVQ